MASETKQTAPSQQNNVGKKKRQRKAIDPNETKEQKFVRLANVRVNRLIRVARHVSNLSKKASYSYNDDQAKKLVDAVNDAAAHVKKAFEGTTQSDDGFKL